MANRFQEGMIVGALALAATVTSLHKVDEFLKTRNNPPTNLQPPTIYLPTQSVPFNQTPLYESLRNKEGLTPPESTPFPEQRQYTPIPNYRPPIFEQEESIESESRLA